MKVASCIAASIVVAALATSAAAYPDKQVQYIIPFAPAGESDVAARLQAQVFQAKYKQEMIVINKPGAGGGLAWSQMNNMPGDGHTIVGVNLPHIVLQPLEPDAPCKTEDITPVYFFHYTPDAIIVAADSPFKTFADLVRAAREKPESVTIAGSGTNSANHVAHGAARPGNEDQDDLRAVQGYRGPALFRVGRPRVGDDVLLDARDPAEGQDADAGRGDREAAAAVSRRADVSRAGVELGRRRLSRHRRAQVDAARRAQGGLRHDGRRSTRIRTCASEMFEGGFEVVDITLEMMPAFMKERTQEYLNSARSLGLVK